MIVLDREVRFFSFILNLREILWIRDHDASQLKAALREIGTEIRSDGPPLSEAGQITMSRGGAVMILLYTASLAATLGGLGGECNRQAEGKQCGWWWNLRLF